MNIKRIKTHTLKIDENLTERIQKQIQERATANTSSNYGSTPCSMQVKNIRSIEFGSKRNNQTALSVNAHGRFNGSLENSIVKKRSETAGRDMSPIQINKDQISECSYQDEDRISRKSQGSNLKEFSKSITSSIGSIFKKQNMIKIAPTGGSNSEVKIDYHPQEEEANRIQPEKDSQSSKLRLKIKKQLKLYGNIFGGARDNESFENYRQSLEDKLLNQIKQNSKKKYFKKSELEQQRIDKIKLEELQKMKKAQQDQEEVKYAIPEPKVEKLMPPKHVPKIQTLQILPVPKPAPKPKISEDQVIIQKSPVQVPEQKKVFQNTCFDHNSDEAIFYCRDDEIFLCEDCYKSHSQHKADYIKNLLAGEFNDWSALMDHAQRVTKQQIDRNVSQQKQLMVYLQKTQDDLPDINAFTLQVIFRNYIHKLQEKIYDVRELSKQGQLEKVLAMRGDIAVFTSQLQEMQQRASLTSMFSSILKTGQSDDDLKIYQGVSLQKKFFLLRKQYDQKMKHFENVMISQSKEIAKLQIEVENLQKEQSPEYHHNMENINENFTQLSQFMKTQHQQNTRLLDNSPIKITSKQTKRARIFSNHENQLIMDSYLDNETSGCAALGIKKFETQSQIFSISRRESKIDLRKSSVNTQSVNSHNIGEKLKYMQINDILDDDVLGEREELVKIISNEHTVKNIAKSIGSPQHMEEFEFLKKYEENEDSPFQNLVQSDALEYSVMELAKMNKKNEE